MNFLLRALSAAVLIPVVIWAVFTGGIIIKCLIALVVAICLMEFGAMLLGKRKTALFFYAVLGSAFSFLIMTISDATLIFLLFFFVSALFGAMFVSFPEWSSAQIATFSMFLFGLFYVCGGLVSIQILSERGGAATAYVGASFVFLVFAVTWSNDTFAYFCGRAFGRHKLFERVSKKKTWEGFIGGAIAGILIPFALKALFGKWGFAFFVQLETQDLVFVGILGALFAPLGDLIESRIKRAYNVKDSGNIIPGHGGLLDRVDSVLLVAPLTLAYVCLFTNYFAK